MLPLFLSLGQQSGKFEVRLLKAFYKDFLYAIIDTDKDTQQVMIDAWLKTEYESWLEKKAETGELSDIIKTKE